MRIGYFQKWTSNGWLCLFFQIIFLLSVSVTAAQNKVVVVPLFDDQNAAGSPAPIPRTGQTTSYGEGDDGALEKGVAWPDPRFTDNGDGTVTDNLTGLNWLKDTNCFGRRTWADALSDCSTLNSGECGLTDGSSEGDWRLPNVKELQSLVDYGQAIPALPNLYYNFFTPTTGIYWSSTSDADATDNAWYLEMSHGYAYYESKTNTHYEWPVRDGN